MLKVSVMATAHQEICSPRKNVQGTGVLPVLSIYLYERMDSEKIRDHLLFDVVLAHTAHV